jgi:hypothetical protein
VGIDRAIPRPCLGDLVGIGERTGDRPDETLLGRRDAERDDVAAILGSDLS